MNSMQKPRILIIDDVPANLGMLVNMLEEYEFEIMVARDGRKGVEVAEHVVPDLILLDALMPDMDGFETCRQLKRLERTQEIPVIFMTALDNVEHKIKGFQVGAVDYITKPIQLEELFARISTHLRIRTLQTQLEAQNQTLAVNNEQLIAEIAEREQAQADLLKAHADLSDAHADLSDAHTELKSTLCHLQQTQDQLIESEKMAALGKLVASIAHEINTPIGAVQSSINNIDHALRRILQELPTFFQVLSAERREDFFTLLRVALQEKPQLSIKEEGRRQRALLHVLHDYGLECPPNIADMLVNIGIHTDVDPYIPLLCDPQHPGIIEMAYHLVGLQESTDTIMIAIKRATKIVFALKTYARRQTIATNGQMVTENVVDGLETTLTLYRNYLKRGVEVVRHYGDVPPIPCYPDELNQVWTNLIHNAIQAMDYQGTLTIDSAQQNGDLVVSITDTGKGIPDDVQQHIFEPFFTTKPVGEGTGLGLDIVKKIILKHAGSIDVTSQPGATTFCVHLPMHSQTP